jgi:hypothetical protein
MRLLKYARFGRDSAAQPKLAIFFFVFSAKLPRHTLFNRAMPECRLFLTSRQQFSTRLLLKVLFFRKRLFLYSTSGTFPADSETFKLYSKTFGINSETLRINSETYQNNPVQM